MTRWYSKLLLLVSVVAVLSPLFIHAVQSELQNYKKTVLTVGYLTAMKGELKDRQGLAISGALTMALDEVLFQIFLFLIIILKQLFACSMIYGLNQYS